MNLLLDTHIFIYLRELIKNQQETNDLTVLPVALTHVLSLDSLPFHHKDPFDRLLIAQSVEEDLTLVAAGELRQIRKRFEEPAAECDADSNGAHDEHEQ